MQKLQLQQQVGFHQRANVTNLLRVRSDADCAASVAVDCAHFWIEARAIFVRFSQRFSISHLIFTSSAPLSLSAPTSLYILQLYRYLRLYLWLYLWLWLYLCLSNSCSCIYSPSSPPTGGTSLSGLPAWVHFNCQCIPARVDSSLDAGSGQAQEAFKLCRAVCYNRLNSWRSALVDTNNRYVERLQAVHWQCRFKLFCYHLRRFVCNDNVSITFRLYSSIEYQQCLSIVIHYW